MRIALIAALLVACGSTSPAPTPTTRPLPSSDPASTGPLTEEQFKALHALPTDGPQDTKGTRITLADGSSAYLSLPAGPGPHPGIVVIHEWWGLNKNIEHWADRLASAGWAAVAVDLYGKVTTTREDAMAAVKAVDKTKATATIKAALDYLASDAAIAATTRAVIGWCFGGGWSLQSALAFSEVNGAIMYYGRLETDPMKLSAIRGQLLGIFGTRDEGIPQPEVDKFEAALTTAKIPHEILRYDAKHAFANPSNPDYDEKSSAQAWTKVLAFLDKLKK